MDTVLGPKYRGKGVLKFVLSKAVSQLTRTLGLRVKTVASDKPYFVKDTFYVINALVRLVRHVLPQNRLFPQGYSFCCLMLRSLGWSRF